MKSLPLTFLYLYLSWPPPFYIDYLGVRFVMESGVGMKMPFLHIN